VQHAMGHGPAHDAENDRALKISGWLTGVYFIIELAIGLATGSIAVISDAFHTFSAVGGVILAFDRHGDGAEVREGRFWMRQAEGDHPFIDVDEALVFTEGHRVQQGFDGADPVSRTRFLFQQTGSSSRSCRHHDKVRFDVSSVLQVHASVFDGDDPRVGLDGYPDLVEGGEDPTDEVRPAGLQDQALTHVQALSPRPE